MDWDLFHSKIQAEREREYIRFMRIQMLEVKNKRLHYELKVARGEIHPVTFIKDDRTWQVKFDILNTIASLKRLRNQIDDS